MKFSAARETLLKPLQTVVGVVERRQTMPILSNVLLSTQGSKLSITATDLEVEMVAEAEVNGDGAGDITVPGRKLHDIFRALPEGTSVEFSLNGDRLTIKAGRSRFTLSTLRAADFPTIDEIGAKQTLRLTKPDLRRLVEKTHFFYGPTGCAVLLERAAPRNGQETPAGGCDGRPPSRAIGGRSARCCDARRAVDRAA
jgi:DNA polymerase-3 subunit beta